MLLRTSKAFCLAAALLFSQDAFAKEAKTPASFGDSLSKIISILNDLKNRPNPKGATEVVLCTSADGLKITYKTSSKQGRPLVGLITVSADRQTLPIAGLSLSSYLNADDQIVMEAYRGSESSPYFSLRAELARTTSPAVDQVATYIGRASFKARGRDASRVTCGVTRAGAGT